MIGCYSKESLHNVVAGIYGVTREDYLSLELKVLNIGAEVEKQKQQGINANRVMGELVKQVTYNSVAIMDQMMQESEKKLVMKGVKDEYGER